jgi:hypothetical protein
LTEITEYTIICTVGGFKMRAVALRCPYCHCGFEQRDEIIRCNKCRTIHHSSCWSENQHCSVFACNGDGYSFFSIPLFVQIAPPILLLLLVLFPDGMSFLAPLLIPALLCAILMLIGFISHLVHGDFKYLARRHVLILCCVCNLISICYTFSKFLRL